MLVACRKNATTSAGQPGRPEGRGLKRPSAAPCLSLSHSPSCTFSSSIFRTSPLFPRLSPLSLSLTRTFSSWIFCTSPFILSILSSNSRRICELSFIHSSGYSLLYFALYTSLSYFLHLFTLIFKSRTRGASVHFHSFIHSFIHLLIHFICLFTLHFHPLAHLV